MWEIEKVATKKGERDGSEVRDSHRQTPGAEIERKSLRPQHKRG